MKETKNSKIIKFIESKGGTATATQLTSELDLKNLVGCLRFMVKKGLLVLSTDNDTKVYSLPPKP